MNFGKNAWGYACGMHDSFKDLQQQCWWLVTLKAKFCYSRDVNKNPI